MSIHVYSRCIKDRINKIIYGMEYGYSVVAMSIYSLLRSIASLQ